MKKENTIITIMLTIMVLCMVLCMIAPVRTKMFAGIGFVCGCFAYRLIEELEKRIVVIEMGD